MPGRDVINKVREKISLTDWKCGFMKRQDIYVGNPFFILHY